MIMGKNKRPQDSGVITYDPERLQKELEGLAAGWKQMVFTRFSIYRDAFEWFGPKMLA